MKAEIIHRPDRAERVIAFAEQLIVPSGAGQGKPFVLMDFQKEWIRDIYSPHYMVDGKLLRRVRKAILSEARKNGKTAIIAILVLAHLIGPEAIQNGEVFSAANDREQAGIVFKFARQIVEKDEELTNLIKVVPSSKTLVCYQNGSFYRALSADAGTKHGLNPSFAIYDELAQSKTQDLFDVLDTSFGAREEPLMAIISTQSNDPTHILSQLIDEGLRDDDDTTVCHLFAVPDDTLDIFEEKVWYLANPALGVFKGLEYMRAQADKARRMPSFENAFRNLELNQRVNPISSLISRQDWSACQQDVALVPGEDVYAGLDLSSTTDLTAFILGSAKAGETRVKPFFWKPEGLVEEHEKRDGVPYRKWAEQGHLFLCPGRAIDLEFVATKIAELSEQYKILGMAYDRWRMMSLLKEFDRISFAAYKEGDPENGIKLVPWGQGYVDMAPSVDALERQVMDYTLKHDGHPVLTWNMANAVVTTSPAGDRKLDKSAARFRIDGSVALAMMLGLKARDLVEDTGPSFWEQISASG